MCHFYRNIRIPATKKSAQIPPVLRPWDLQPKNPSVKIYALRSAGPLRQRFHPLPLPTGQGQNLGKIGKISLKKTGKIKILIIQAAGFDEVPLRQFFQN